MIRYLEKQLEELMKTHQTLEYITKLNKSLLLLTKIDNGQFTDTKQLELNGLLKQYLQDYEEVYDYRNIEVTIDEQDIFNVTMNESLAVALLTNLLKMHLYITLTGDDIRITVTKNKYYFPKFRSKKYRWIRNISSNVSIKELKRKDLQVWD